MSSERKKCCPTPPPIERMRTVYCDPHGMKACTRLWTLRLGIDLSGSTGMRFVVLPAWPYEFQHVVLNENASKYTTGGKPYRAARCLGRAHTQNAGALSIEAVQTWFTIPWTAGRTTNRTAISLAIDPHPDVVSGAERKGKGRTTASAQDGAADAAAEIQRQRNATAEALRYLGCPGAYALCMFLRGLPIGLGGALCAGAAPAGNPSSQRSPTPAAEVTSLPAVGCSSLPPCDPNTLLLQ